MAKAGLVESPRRACIRITDMGREVLTQNPERIDINFLKQYPEFVEFRNARREDDDTPAPPDRIREDLTPVEALETAYQILRRELASELLTNVKSCSPAFFERLVVDLLIGMNYGGSRKEAGQALGKSGDEGVDGIIKEDRLGLDVIYLQVMNAIEHAPKTGNAGKHIAELMRSLQMHNSRLQNNKITPQVAATSIEVAAVELFANACAAFDYANGKSESCDEVTRKEIFKSTRDILRLSDDHPYFPFVDHFHEAYEKLERKYPTAPAP